MQKTILFLLLFGLLGFYSCEKNKDNNNSENTDPPENQSLDFIPGWTIESKPHSMRYLHSISFANDTVGYIGCVDGRYYKTTNAGDFWTEYYSGKPNVINSIYFYNKDIGIMAQAGVHLSGSAQPYGARLLKTKDGGNSWQSYVFENCIRFNSLYFKDTLNGLSIINVPDVPNSKNNFLAKTTDGGVSWDSIRLNISEAVDNFEYVDETIFVSGNKVIYKSHDFGETWDSLYPPAITGTRLIRLHFYNRSIGYVTDFKYYYKTIDGGHSWKTADTSLIYKPYTFFHFISEMEYLIIRSHFKYEGYDIPSYKGTESFYTTDGGDSWDISELNTKYIPGTILFPRKYYGIVVNFSETYIISKD